ncbi:MAG: bifunctional phosphoribosylaminoimidazolecarboxamide formyltransferase/IMP cyclohydrolase [Firmicutes bacterium]|nr:bifunctional phosphoribosylaminoimidazolecarboxamide formyltransferase/IMP cyclohydrolase [Bacillota bacterium]
MQVRRALISVSDKAGVREFARALADMGVTLLSTGGTYEHLKEAGIPVLQVSDVTGFPEILAGRVKTLHPTIHGGILARRDVAQDMESIARLGIDPIDMVVVNLYPFRETAIRPGVTLEEAVEQIDIGGPTLVRAAAKNHRDVLVVVRPDRYGEVLEKLRAGEGISPDYRRELAWEAFAHTAAYDAAIAAFLRERAGKQGAYPEELTLPFKKVMDLRYGENPHQSAALYKDVFAAGPSVVGAELLHGKPLSFNNVNDAAAAFDIVCEFTEPAAVAVKHTNPCGVGIGADVMEAYRRAHDSDPTSIFGGIVAFNRTVDEAVARELAKIFLEVIIAPGFTEGALAVLTQKPSLRLLRTGQADRHDGHLDLKRVRGGLLVQEADVLKEDPRSWRVVTERGPTDEELEALWFGWRVVKHVKSNAIVLVRDGQTVGIGAGQMNRILPTRMSIAQAGDKAKGACLASDAFFPFSDVVQAAAEAGITAIVQPGGSKRDQESIDAANAAGIAMVFTGVRHFKH